MKRIERLEFELAYYDVAVEHTNHNSTGTFPKTDSLIDTILIICI